MKLEALDILNLKCTVSGRMVKAFLFNGGDPKIALVGELLDPSPQYEVIISRVDAVSPPPKSETTPVSSRLPDELGETVILPLPQPITDEECFCQIILARAGPRGDWIVNTNALEARRERTLVSTFYNGTELKPEYELWRELIEKQTLGIENAGIGVVAMIPLKPYELAETPEERNEMEQKAVDEALHQLHETAIKFYRGTLNEQEPELEGVFNQLPPAKAGGL